MKMLSSNKTHKNPLLGGAQEPVRPLAEWVKWHMLQQNFLKAYFI
jgi:hypothetical protein